MTSNSSEKSEKKISESKSILAKFQSFFSPTKTSHRKITTCDLGRMRTVLLELEKRSDHLFIHQFKIIKNAIREQKTSSVLESFLNGKVFSNVGIRASLKGHAVVIRFIRFPKMSHEELKSAMSFEAEQYIPFKLNEVALDFAVIENSIKTSDGEKMEVMIVAIKKQDLEPTLEVFRLLDVKLSLLDVDILAALTALEYFHPVDFSQHIAFLDLGTELSTLGFVRDGKPHFIRDISYGTYDLHKRLKTKTGISDDECDAILENKEKPSDEAASAIKESLESLVGDLRISFDYYHDQALSVSHPQPIGKVFVCGGAVNELILKTLEMGLKMPVKSMDVLGKIQFSELADRNEFAANASLLTVALGLGIREQ